MSELEKFDNITTRKTGVLTQRVKELRESLKLTQQGFADGIGTSVEIIQKVEQQAKGLTLNIALKIAEKHNVSLDYLFNRNNVPNDMAWNIFVNLRDMFRITLEDTDTLSVSQECLTLSIDENLYDFIVNMCEAEKMKTKMSEKLYNEWINELVQGYNAKIKDNVKGSPIKYQLINPEKLTSQDNLSK